MKIIHLGVGEAFDETLPNNSNLILSRTNLLLDCGYSIPHQLWKYNPDRSFLDGIYISHLHADHYFGLPALLTRMWEEKRKKPLTIICQKGAKTKIRELIDFAYKNIASKFEFAVDFVEVESSQKIKFNEFELSFAPTIHAVPNLAIKIQLKNKILCYSGDGQFTEEPESLYWDADLVIHEAFTFDEKLPNHACITDLIGMAKRNDVKCLALTHIRRDVRKCQMSMINKRISGEKIKIIVPEPMDEYKL